MSEDNLSSTTTSFLVLGIVAATVLSLLSNVWLTTTTSIPAAFAQPNLETIKKICGDTAVGFEKGTCYYPVTYDCSGFPGSFPDDMGSCIDSLTGLFAGFATVVCNQGGEPTRDDCVGKPTGPTRQ